MRFSILPALLLVSVAAPALAQSAEPLDKRLNRIEKELRAVQRKVFPGGAGATVEPEIAPQQAPTQLPGVPASSAVADLTARVDALEGQLRTLTNQAEENGFRLRQLETAFAQFKADQEARSAPAPQVVAPPPPALRSNGPESAPQSDDTTADAAPASGDPGEDAYTAGYRLWSAGKYAQAAQALDAMIKKYPKHKRVSYARNLLGRAYLDDGKPATAAKTFLANYQIDPKGDRAPDSLYFLGDSLVRLGKPAEACKVYDELQDVYGATMRDWVKQRLPKARTDAKCS